MEEIYKEYSRIVYNYLLSFTNNKDTAEELMQETFYSAVKNINKFRKEASVKTWLCKIAKNKWIDYYNKLQKSNEISIDDVNEKYLLTYYLQDNNSNIDEILDINRKIHRLDQKAKEVIYLRICADFSFREIGNIIGKSEEWARITFYRAKIKLKEEFENE